MIKRDLLTQPEADEQEQAEAAEADVAPPPSKFEGITVPQTPAEVGLTKWAKFRTEQTEALKFWLSPKPNSLSSLPMGVGKSVAAMTFAKMLAAKGMRTLILTATKALQDQYQGDFEQFGLADIRGRQNYNCAGLSPANQAFISGIPNCKNSKDHCPLIQGNGCAYETFRDNARQRAIVCTNYKYWITLCSVNLQQQTLGTFDCIILDEGHLAFKQLAGSIKVELRERDLRYVGIKSEELDALRKDDPTEIMWPELIHWAGRIQSFLSEIVVKHEMDGVKGRKAELAEELLMSIGSIRSMKEEDWLVCKGYKRKEDDGFSWDVECVNISRHTERYLFTGIPKRIIMSGTLKPFTARLLGISKDKMDFKEWFPVFPAVNCPIIHVKSVKMNYENEHDPELMERWISLIDAYIEPRLGRKGMIQTVSYGRQKFLMDHSKWSHFITGNTQDPDSDSATDAAQKFREASAPAIIASPSLGTGWDFPGSECMWIILCKVPFQNPNDPLLQARLALYPGLDVAMTMEDLVQSSKRGQRAFKDKCEVAIFDDNVVQFMGRNRNFIPKGWSFRTEETIPKVCWPNLQLGPRGKDGFDELGFKLT